LWLIPSAEDAKPPKSLAGLAEGVRLYRDARHEEALKFFTAPALEDSALSHYARYFSGLVYLNTSRPDRARAAFAVVHKAQPVGFLSEAAARREAEAAAAAGDFPAAVALYEEVAAKKNAAPEAVLLALAQAHDKSGDRGKALETFTRLYYEFPLSELAAVAAAELGDARNAQALRQSETRYKLELGRAERLFASRRYQAAREAFDVLKQVASGDDKELVSLRLAECDHYLGRHAAARDALLPFLERASRKAEARFFHLTATRELGRHDEYIRLARALVKDFPDSSWAEETLNNLGTHYILVDEDGEAAKVFAQLYSTFPQGRHAARAAWKAGWWAFKHGDHDRTIDYFESAASRFPRSDYRPTWLYWAARARELSGDRTGAAGVYRIVHADYQASYYGRISAPRLKAIDTKAAVRPGTVTGAPEPAVALASGEASEDESPAVSGPPPNAETIRLLASLELYDLARDEVLFAQRNHGDSALLNATLAWTYYKQNDLRRGTVYMKRAYPHYLSSEGASLPAELLRVIFPLDHWASIKRHSARNGLDPYLVAALINQESAFLPDARSRANAIGLMQILPSTGRRLARQQRVPRFTAGALTRPDLNIQLGTAYFADLSRRLGGVHLALASYNAGAHRVSIWTSERPGLQRDEFIDDIPFPETQQYVKKILGTAEDYRALYGEMGIVAKPAPAKPGPQKAAPVKKPTTKKPPAKPSPKPKPR
jgi:soluble lytic murein transglycosylase